MAGHKKTPEQKGGTGKESIADTLAELKAEKELEDKIKNASLRKLGSQLESASDPVGALKILVKAIDLTDAEVKKAVTSRLIEDPDTKIKYSFDLKGTINAFNLKGAINTIISTKRVRLKENPEDYFTFVLWYKTFIAETKRLDDGSAPYWNNIVFRNKEDENDKLVISNNNIEDDFVKIKTTLMINDWTKVIWWHKQYSYRTPASSSTGEELDVFRTNIAPENEEFIMKLLEWYFKRLTKTTNSIEKAREEKKRKEKKREKQKQKDILEYQKLLVKRDLDNSLKMV